MEKIWLKQYPKDVPNEINPDIYKSAIDMIDQACEKYSKNKAVTNMGTSLTYTQVKEMSIAFAAYLQQTLKLQKGERIAIMLPNVMQYLIAMFGALRAGLIVVNVNPLYTKRELTHQLIDADVHTIVILKNFAHTLEAALPELKIKNIIITGLGDLLGFPKGPIVNFVVKHIKRLVPRFHLPEAVSFNTALSLGSRESFEPVNIVQEDIAFLQYTGGTTGVAKGAILTHRNFCANTLQAYRWCLGSVVEGEEQIIIPLPLYHIYSLTTCFIHMTYGSNLILVTDPRDVSSFVKLLSTTKFTQIIGVNSLFRLLLLNENFRKLDFSNLKYAIAGAMATTRDVADEWKKVTRKDLTQGYGLTEASPIVSSCLYYDGTFDGSVGFPLPSTEIEVVDKDGNPVPLGKVGELCVRGPQVMKGYWNMPDETKKVLSSDGWLRTGDLVSVNEDGKINIVDRVKDMIGVSGFKVFPNEVEEVLTMHPGIIEAGVVGEPDLAHGEVVKAFVVLRDKNLTKEEIIHYCHEQLTNYKVPKIIVFVDSLPKSPVGKILRKSLRSPSMKAENVQKRAA